MSKTCWDDHQAATPEQNEALEREVAGVLNRACRENVADVPDFILARVMVRALVAFEESLQARNAWFGLGEAKQELEGARDDRLEGSEEGSRRRAR
jgi:hypothetical protein